MASCFSVSYAQGPIAAMTVQFTLAELQTLASAATALPATHAAVPVLQAIAAMTTAPPATAGAAASGQAKP